MQWQALDFDFGGDDTVVATLVDGNHRVEVIADVELNGRRAVLRGLHILGAGRNTLGPAALLRLIGRAKEYLDVDELRVEGAVRTSGAGPERIPAGLVF